jgi:hypothetical protein
MTESSTVATPPFYIPSTDFLQQGDIFRVGIVTPVADAQQRLFRSVDGRHGSVVFAEGTNGRVFDRTELEETLDRLTSQTPLHTRPFRPTPDGQPELAVVFAGFSEHFVIATQTCDVSGHDKKEFPYAMILPARTIMEICQTEQIDLQAGNQPITIEDYLMERTGDVTIASVADATRYSEKLKEVLASWHPTENADKANQRLITKFLNKIRRTAGHLYYLPADDRFHVPELMVDFCTTYTVATRQLTNFASGRVARIGDPYRDHFARAFADRISRIAIPQRAEAPPFEVGK